MRGFSRRYPVEEVLDWLSANIGSGDANRIAVDSAAGRVLYETVRAPHAWPPCDRAGVDGYALRSADTQGAHDYNPLELNLLGSGVIDTGSRAELRAGEAMPVTKNAPIPQGADAVLAGEDAEACDVKLAVLTQSVAGEHVLRRGSEFEQGDILAARGCRLQPRELSVLQAFRVDYVQVWRKPSIGVFIIGDEFVHSNHGECNSAALRSLVERDGGTVEIECLPDSVDQIAAAFCRCSSDLMLACGGTGLGDNDRTAAAVARAGELGAHGVALRPADSAGIGEVNGRVVILIPGGPVAAFAAYELFAGPQVRRLSGLSEAWPYGVAEHTLQSKLVSSPGWADFVRVAHGERGIIPLATQGDHSLGSLARAVGYVVVPSGSEGYASGESVQVRLFGTYR